MKHYKSIFHLLALLVLGILGGSCTQGEEASDRPEDNFHSLWKAIDEHYCFLSYKQQEIGVDWNEVYARYKAKINDKMGKHQLFEVLCNMLAELQDGHVNLYCNSDIGRNWSWHEDYPKNLDEELRQAYLGTGNEYRIANGMKYRILPENVGYLVCESFAQNFSAAALNEILYFFRSCNGLILDVRGNGGGNLTSAEDLTSRFTNERIHVGYFCHKNGPGHDDFSTPQAEYIDPSREIRWQKPCVVLTNRSCYSATNTFVRNMKQCPLVTVVGDQTGGGSGMPFNYDLPNGWIVRMSACPSLDVNRQQIEFGISPDITCSLDSTEASKGKDTMIEKAISVINGASL